ncbi:hypothetical protein ACRXCV_10315 [Halobacteriovorax sp. GFR7]|uniref:hypothetical protein n=1 Tax=unclassified Halobacteriovorax TaxID=2639665 RepID=UPI0037175656
MKVIYLIVFLFITSSCVPQVARPDGFFDDINNIDTCEDLFFLLNEGNVCASSCGEGEVVADESQLEEILADETLDDFTRENIEASAGVCITAPEVIARPSDSVFIDDDFCICKNQKVASVTSGASCAATCQEKTATVATLYGTVTVGPKIKDDANLQNLFGFCNNSIDNGAQNPPSCQLVATDIDGRRYTADLKTYQGTNIFEANLEATTVNFGEAYTFHIEETGSGVENAKSDYEQFKLFEPGDDDEYEGNLKIKLISQYTCMIRATATSSNYDPRDQIYLDTVRKHFYMPVDYPTPYLPPGVSDTIFCHDYIKTGQNDDAPQFPRLELVPDHFSLWDVNDVRFIADGENRKVDFLIKDRMIEMGANVSGTKTYFAPLETCVAPNVSVEDGGFPEACSGAESGLIQSGLAMIPFFTDNSGRAICPGYTEYNSSNIEFKALGEIIGTPTEGLYFAKGPREVIDLGDGNKQEIKPADVMFIREGQLKKIWFHLTNDGIHYKPTSDTQSQPTYFYWPADEDAPYVQKRGYQKLYQVMHSSELASSGYTTSIPTTIKPLDRKMGCIPVTSGN